MTTFTTLRTAIVSFAFTGVFGPHRGTIDFEAPRVTSNDAQAVFLRPAERPALTQH